MAAVFASAVLAALTAGWAPDAGAAENELGQHIASCARTHLGQGENPPSLTCEHDGHVHTFATFGEMVEHMLEGH